MSSETPHGAAGLDQRRRDTNGHCLAAAGCLLYGPQILQMLCGGIDVVRAHA